MIVNTLEKEKKLYRVIIDNKDYLFDEEIIVKYRLAK